MIGLLLSIPLGIQICNIGYTVVGKIIMRIIVAGMMLAWYWWWIEVAWFEKIFRGTSSRVFRSVESLGENMNGEGYGLNERLLNISFERAHEEEILLRNFNENNSPKEKL